jgi:glycosyltransferase involved in cell wall biosynthesis
MTSPRSMPGSASSRRRERRTPPAAVVFFPCVSSEDPAVSILLVSDYGGASSEDWDYLRATLRSLAAQSFDEPVEVLLVDSAPPGQQTPADVLSILPSLRAIRGETNTAALLNDGARAAKSDLVVLLDSDCKTSAGWLGAAVEAMRAHPEAAAASGPTAYEGRSFRNRVLAALSRSFLDPGRPGPTRFVSSNNAIFRRDALLAHPLKDLPRTLALRMQSEEIRLAGGRFYFEPRMAVEHRFEGWPMERRIRRHVGYRTIKVRQLNPAVPYAWLLKLGLLSIPVFVVARTLDSWWDCLRAGRHYRIRWFELPAAFAIAILVHLMEIGGMGAAFADAGSRVVAAGGHAGRTSKPTLER